MTVYRSSNVDQTITDARRVVAEHRVDPDTRCCDACGMTAPCRRARAATGLLAAMGLSDPAEPATNGGVRHAAEGGLLTHGWRVVLGLADRDGSSSGAVKVGQR
ncbi:MAG TPA: hypothetical protein VFC00_19095 [Micromonosporaceae bacterium]|nr:hypothetical protein [Micromonosporaceae bacterium]